MKICLILEGSYPYTYGGVSSWMHQYIRQMTEHEFVLWVVAAHAADSGRFVYKLPDNVTEVHEVFLNDALKIRGKASRRRHLAPAEQSALKELIDCGRPDWSVIFEMFQSGKESPGTLLMSEEFLQILTELCEQQYPYAPFADTFHTIRSMLLPVFYMCGQQIPQADLYHAICTGYAGLLGTLAHIRSGKPLCLTEHGIYSREREEEIIRADWVRTVFKRHWIRFFYMLSDAIYQNAAAVTNLFHRAGSIQADLGADPNHIRTIGNGIDYGKFSSVPQKQPDGFTDVGAVIRLAPIKDVKTLLYAFFEASKRMENLRLHILGGTDDEEYAQECYQIQKDLHLDRVIFTGRVDSAEYMKKLDFTVLSSISEGQPLSVLESMAARRPCVTTEVGCCRELLFGDVGDDFGQAGYLVPPMDRTALAEALLKMARHPEQIRLFGKRGQIRVKTYYRKEDMIEKYRNLYKGLQTYGRNRI